MKRLFFALLIVFGGILHAQPSITVLLPNGGEHLLQDVDYNIAWNSAGVGATVAIEYSTNSGTDWIQITSGAPNTGTYAWRVPLTVSNNQFRVRVLDPAAPSVYDVSDANFSVMFLALTKLNAGEHIQAGKTTRITWNKSANLAVVNVKYSLNNGASWTDAAGASNALNSFDWNVPAGVSSDQCLIKLYDPSANSNVEVQSAATFSIVDLALTQPVGGEKVHAGKTYDIKWTNTAFVSNVKLEYSTNSGTSYTTIESSYPVGGLSNTYTWNVPPGLGSDNCLIRISDAASAPVSDVSPLKFSIYTLTITDPVGSEGLQEGTAYTIKWNSTNLSLVNIYLSTNNGSTWPITIATNVNASDHQFVWTVPANVSDLCKIRIADAAVGSPIKDESPNVFSIKSLTLTAPANGTYIQAGGSAVISWNSSSNIENVNLFYSTDGGSNWISIAASVNAFDGTYTWAVPSGFSTSSGRVRVADAESPAVKAQNSANLNIVSLDLTNPNGGEHIMAGSHFNITWTCSSNLAQVDLDYSIDDGATWTHIVDNVDASLKIYDWTVPANVTNDNCRVRVIGSGVTSAIKDQSANKFSIIKFSITDPDVFVQMQAGKIYLIKWTTSSNIVNFKLEYTTNNGTSWLPIAESVPASQLEYSWTVPNTPSAGCRIRISEVTNAANYVTSSALFTISSLSLTYPNGGESFLNGAKVNITWSSQQITNVKLEYSLNGGTSFSDIIASYSASTGTYEWTVPNGVSSANCIIQISDAAKATINDQSDSPFTISSLSPSAPAAGNVWQAGQVKNIQWTSQNINNVKLEYSTDNGTSWSTITESTPAAAGSYAWTVPATPGFSKLPQCIVKITDQLFPSNSRQTGVFTINPVPAVAVNSPNGFEYWQEGSQHNITWSVTDNIASVVIEYTTNNGATWAQLPGTYTANVSAISGSVLWTVPSSSASTQCRVRVSDASAPTVNDQSDNFFTIASLRVTSPNAGTERWQAGKQYNIIWTSQNISNVKIEYSSDNKATWNSITNSTAADAGSYLWTVPEAASTQCYIRITDAAHSSISDDNDAAFKIVSLIVTSPNGGENYLTGSSHDIVWTSANIANVKVELTSDNGATWSTLAASTAASAGKFTFTAPNISASTFKVRVSDAADASINDLSDNTFTVSELGLTSPVGNEKWKVGTTQYITWKYGSTITNVKVEYRAKDSDPWIMIASSLAMPVSQTTYSYKWVVPNTPSDFCRVRVSSVANPEVNSFSQAYFTIDKNVIVTSPNGGEAWEIGSIHNITWQADPSVTAVKIQYSIDNGNTWPDALTIKSPVDAVPSTFAWQVPNNPSKDCLIRITDINNTDNSDESNAKFAIISTPSVTVTTPNGGETFETGAQENITWSSNNVSTVKIEYTLDNGSTWKLIKSNLLSSGLFVWDVPNIKSTQCRIRITDESNPNNYDISDNKFTINPRITITAPNGGENLAVGSTYPVTWSSTNVTNVKIDYSTNNGNTWQQVTASTAAAAGTFSWKIPNTPAQGCLIKVSDADPLKPEVYDVSDAVFSITSPLLMVSPNGGEVWQAGSQHDIKWTANSSIANVALAYSTDGGSTWNASLISGSTPASSGTFRWTVPLTLTSKQMKIKVSNSTDGTVYDASDNVFTVSALKLVSPNGGESWAIGSKQTITWTSSNVGLVDLRYSINNGLNWDTIATRQASNGIYYWDIPAEALSQSSQCLVKINDSDYPEVNDLSDAIFSITQAPVITLLYPVGGEFFTIGTTQIIKWKSTNVANVKIEYSINNGSIWKPVISSTPSTGSYSWVVPSENSNLCKIRISDASKPGINAVSAQPFTISTAPIIKVAAPNGGENFAAGSVQKITWTSSNVGYVKIEYSINNGIDWISISNGYASSGVYSWTVPATPSTQCKVRISDTTNIGTFDISDNNFTISESPYIKVVYPNGGENFASGTKEVIKWASSNVSDVKIEYSINNGSDWYLIVSSPYPNPGTSTGSYTWQVPVLNSNMCKVRISSLTSTDLSDMSDSVFTISNLPKITVSAPNGDETWAAGSVQKITWTSSNVSNVRIDYSINNGKDWDLIEAAYPSSGQYSWTVPNKPSVQCLVRITDAANSQYASPASDVSDRVFSILPAPALQVTAPNGGEIWEIGKVQNITWNSTNIKNVRIEYSINNGKDWLSAAANIVNTGTYAWTIPNTPSSLCLVRVSDVLSPAANDVSDAVFTIAAAPRITVAGPNGGEIYPAGSIQKVTWTSVSVTSVKIQLSINNGISWTTLTSGVPSSGIFSYIVPSTPSTQCKIRVSDSTNAGTYDISDNSFTITEAPFVSITYPNGKEKLVTGTTEVIKWISTNVSNVKIEYSLNNGIDWNLIATAPGTGSYNWLVPNTTSNMCRVRITDVTKADVSDISDTVFAIVNPSKLILVSPNGDESWSAGSQQQVKWSSSNVGNIKIEYSINKGIDWYLIEQAYPSSGLYKWTIPNTLSSQCLLRISDAANSLISDVSDNVFSIVPAPEIRIVSPNGNEKWEIGKTQTITWTSVNINNVKIELSTNNGSTWSSVMATLSNTGSYVWTVPNSQSEFCKIKVSDVLNAATSDVSDQVFSIITPPKITVTSPNGGEAVKTGSVRNLTWSSSNVEVVKIEYSINNGVSWKTIADTLPSTGSYNWKVPETPSYQCKVRISDANKPDMMDVSDNTFTIARLELLTPTAGESILTGSLYAITWESECINNVKMDYSTDKGATWANIAQSVAAINGTYSWAVPTVNIPQCLVRIFDANNPSIYEITEGTVSIQQLIVISPEEKVRWKMGAIQSIIWKSYNVNNVKLEYSTDNGQKWNVIAASVSAKLGSFDWVVPQTPSDLCIVKITDVANTQNFNNNRGNFSIGNTTGVDAFSSVKPENFMLYQNHPNPFNPSTRIRYQVPETEFVSLRVYDAMGREVSMLVNEEQGPGIYEAVFDGLNLANGVYIYRLQAGKFMQARKLILMK